MQVYLQHVLQMLQSAMTLSVQQLGNDDLADYNNSLRHGKCDTRISQQDPLMIQERPVL